MTTFVRRRLPGRSAIGDVGLAAVAANLSHVQLFNPAASGVLLHPYAVVMNIGAAVQAGTWSLFFHDVALTTLLVGHSLTADRRIVAAPVAQLRTQANAVTLPAAANRISVPTFSSLLGQSFVLEPLVGWVLLEGQGLVVVPQGNPNTTCSATWLWSEEST